jgi:hypothetical protein
MSVASRPRSFHTILTFVLLITSASASSDCAPPAIPIRIGNVTFSNGQTERGLDIAVGTPPQPFAFLPVMGVVYGRDAVADIRGILITYVRRIFDTTHLRTYRLTRVILAIY